MLNYLMCKISCYVLAWKDKLKYGVNCTLAYVMLTEYNKNKRNIKLPASETKKSWLHSSPYKPKHSKT